MTQLSVVVVTMAATLSFTHVSGGEPFVTKKRYNLASQGTTFSSLETPGTDGNTEKENSVCSSSLYSCNGRCALSPRPACSCHISCTVYGNCCEDFMEFCYDEEDLSSFHKPVGEVKCVDHSLLVSTCGASNETLLKNDMGIGLLEELLNFEEHLKETILPRCEQEASVHSSLLDQVPVSASGIHYKNAFCAVCNGAQYIEYWQGVVQCKGREVKIVENLSVTATREELFKAKDCEVIWLPKIGIPNVCFDSARDGILATVSDAEESSEEGVKVETRLREESSEIGRHATVNNGTETMPGLALEWEEVDHLDTDPKHVTNHSETFLEEKCNALTSYVMDDHGHLYKNKYCGMLEKNLTQWNTPCEPLFPRLLDVSGNWSIIKLTNEEGTAEIWTTTNEHHMIDQLNGKPPVESCDPTTHLHIRDECLGKAFILRITMNFTYERSAVIRGNFRDQSWSFSELAVTTFSGDVSNTTICLKDGFSLDQLSGNKFSSHAVLRCANTEVSFNPSEVDTPMLVDRKSGEMSEVLRHTSFVSTALKALMSVDDAMKLPVTLEIYLCVIPTNGARYFTTGYCSSVHNVWRASRKVDAIIGNISLEGIITIICLILSDLGLLVRLALQNVVPFYKSYPGKVQFSLCLSLLFAYSFFLVGGMVEEGSKSCMVVAVLTHTAFLSALFWMNVTAFEIWRTFRHWTNQVVSRGTTSLILSTVYAVGLPIGVVTAALILQELSPWSEFSPSYGEHYCWLNGTMAVATFFVAPVSFICCTNAVFVGLTLRGLRRQRTSISEFKKSNAMTAFTDTTIVVKIILLVGITWLLGLLAAVVDHQAMWIIYTIINASLGFLISVVLVFNKRVYYAVQNRCLCYNVDSLAVVSTQVPKHTGHGQYSA